VRNEYVGLVREAPLPAALKAESLAFDIGTGTGVLAAVLARRGVKKIIATDCDPRAIVCAKENMARLMISPQTVVVKEANFFPNGLAALIVCNPPWLPARATAPIERAIYDEDSAMLKGFLNGLVAHLAPGGEGWLILSDLAVHLGLRTAAQLHEWISAAGLTVIGREDTAPTHRKATTVNDPLHAARAAEIVSLWRLGVATVG
jgi:methylase of polypeptide subunit release factors